MLTFSRLLFYIAYLFFLAIWLGSTFHEFFSTNISWFIDPMKYISHSLNHPIPGLLNPWPVSTFLLLIPTVLSFISFIKYKGIGKAYVLISVIGTFVVIIASLAYLDPTLKKIFTETGDFTAQQLEALSRIWIFFNFSKLILLMALFILGLVGLYKFERIEAE